MLFSVQLWWSAKSKMSTFGQSLLVGILSREWPSTLISVCNLIVLAIGQQADQNQSSCHCLLLSSMPFQQLKYHITSGARNHLTAAVTGLLQVTACCLLWSAVISSDSMTCPQRVHKWPHYCLISLVKLYWIPLWHHIWSKLALLMYSLHQH